MNIATIRAGAFRAVVVLTVTFAAYHATADQPQPCRCAVPLEWEPAYNAGPCFGALGVEAEPQSAGDLYAKSPLGFNCKDDPDGRPCPSSRCCRRPDGGTVFCQQFALDESPCVLVNRCVMTCCRRDPFMVQNQNQCIGWMTLACQ